MKLAGSIVGRFVRTPDPQVRAALIYGDDVALVAARREQLSKSILGEDSPELRLARLDAASIRKDPASLYDALRESAFFGGRRLVQIDGATDGMAKILSTALEDTTDEDAFLLVTAGSLPARSKLRAGFEGPAFSVAAPCYSDSVEAEDLSEALSELELHFRDRDAESSLRSQRAELDYGAFQQLLAKLAVYKLGDDTPVAATDIEACAPLPDDPQAHEIAAAVLGGDVEKAAIELARVRSNSSAGSALLIALSWQMKRLYGAVVSIDSGAPRDKALSGLRPPVFGEARAQLSRQLDRWSRPALESAIQSVHETQLSSRSAGGAEPDAAIARALLRIAMMASRR